MADLIFPPSLAPRRVTWTLERNVATYTSPYSFTSQRNDLGRAARWRATIEMPPLPPDDAALLSTWLDQISRGEHVGLVPVAQNDVAGTEVATSTFQSQQAPWLARAPSLDWTSGGLVSPLYLSDGNVVIYSGGSPPGYMDRLFAATSGLPYTMIVDVPEQITAGRISVNNFDNSLSFFDTGPGRPVQPGRYVTSLFPADSSGIRVYLNAGDNAQSFIRSLFGNLSFTRTYVTSAAAASGSNILSIRGGAFGNIVNNIYRRAMKQGQFVMVRSSRGYELKRIKASVDLIVGGSLNGNSATVDGRMIFEPALRGAVASNAAVIHNDPWCRMRLATSESTAVVDAPNFSGFTFDMLEDIAP